MEGGFHEWACFAAQQAGEKAAKAVYSRLGGAAWGHSVAALLVGLRERVDVADEMVAQGRLLDRFYVPARYPNGWEEGILVVLERSDLRWIDRAPELLSCFDDVGLPVELFCYTREEAGRVALARRAAERAVPLAERSPVS